jgi:hypothetical protein
MRRLVTSDTFAQVKSSKLFFTLNIFENEEYEDDDELVNIDNGETIQVKKLIKKHFKK